MCPPWFFRFPSLAATNFYRFLDLTLTLFSDFSALLPIASARLFTLSLFLMALLVAARLRD